MTIIYTTRGSFPFVALLFRWHGSLYKSLWKKLAIFCLAYAIVSLIARLGLNNAAMQNHFNSLVTYFDGALGKIPLQFLLGFYVAMIVTRWWEQFNLVTWPDRFMLFVTAYIQADGEQPRRIRRALGRYANLTCLMVWRDLSSRVMKRFPSLEHICQAGLMTKEEMEAYEAMRNPIQYIPSLQWMTTLIHRAEKIGAVDSVKANELTKEVATLREQMAGITGYDWVKVPLIYTQMTTVAVYGYFLFAVLGRQYKLPSGKEEIDLYVPLQTILEFLFYMGWLQVAEDIFDPFGEDEEDLELNVILETNVKCASTMANYDHSRATYVGTETEWEKLPHTRASKKIKDRPFLGHMLQLRLRDEEMEIIDVEEVPKSVVNEAAKTTEAPRRKT